MLSSLRLLVSVLMEPQGPQCMLGLIQASTREIICPRPVQPAVSVRSAGLSPSFRLFPPARLSSGRRGGRAGGAGPAIRPRQPGVGPASGSRSRVLSPACLPSLCRNWIWAAPPGPPPLPLPLHGRVLPRRGQLPPPGEAKTQDRRDQRERSRHPSLRERHSRLAAPPTPHPPQARTGEETTDTHRPGRPKDVARGNKVPVDPSGMTKTGPSGGPGDAAMLSTSAEFRTAVKMDASRRGC
ncbi:hypothetical protein ANANG_G00305070 [Anguilla anguilla]|uniref:Uncharacterized protein n=1 Tax=Anguilla anguilla TaxID=7936 RepID=A0A9D3RKY7_ANGAN|nr:hypothetical protein ANANG_G00305070 [Anguilla anguilla]